MVSENTSKLEHYISSVKNKRVLIMGLGLQGSGIGATKFFVSAGCEVKVTDLKTPEQLHSSLEKIKELQVTYSLGKHEEADFLWADIVVVNPDVWIKNPDSPYLELAKKNGKQIETESGLFVELAGCPVIGVTGTRGKTTTTIACARMLENAGYSIVLGGNVPESETLNYLPQTYSADYAVLELSNFQLYGLHLKQLSPNIAIITSISPDHLISYPTMEAYVEDKKAIYRYQKDTDCLIAKNDSWGNVFISEAKGKTYQFSRGSLPSNWLLKLKGVHNRENLGAVYTLGRILKVKDNLLELFITSFTGVEYRLQTIAENNGVIFVNDTTASTPTAAEIALKSFPSGKIIWIAGGNSKKLPHNDLVSCAVQKVKKILLLEGNATQGFKEDLKNAFSNRWDEVNLGTYNNFKEAITAAYRVSSPGDVVLLSPGFTSFGMFANEFERGRLFNQYVSEL